MFIWNEFNSKIQKSQTRTRKQQLLNLETGDEISSNFTEDFSIQILCHN